MRLLHTGRLDFQEFFDSQTPKYAILSHRWTSDEVSFQDFDHYKNGRKPSFSKVKNFCALAKNNNYEWAWIDTCCIDKKSSAELTEAINSMYAWYQKAEICYAYLADVLLVEDEFGNWEGTRDEFRRSAWFTRGWTLQELLAPNHVVFFGRSWGLIGHKGLHGASSPLGRSLERDISDVTGISEKHLLGQEYLSQPTIQCIAKKLSWVSKRKTTRVEDMAYCILGLCGVNMPLLYGEGEMAFYRLQLEIIKNSDDDSIFAWFCDNNGRPSSYISGIIAQSPRNFAGSGHIERLGRSMGDPYLKQLPYSMTNKALAYPVSQPNNRLDDQSTYAHLHLLPLESTTMSNNPGTHIANDWHFDVPATVGAIRPFQSRRVTVYLLKIAGDWRRLQIKDKYVIPKTKPGNTMVDERVHLFQSFETIYVRNSDLIDIEDMEEFWLEKYRPPQGWENDVLQDHVQEVGICSATTEGHSDFISRSRTPETTTSAEEGTFWAL
ncbi:MAG: hypothetical protein Q9221_008252 [Calogaya cf. arnoldii]